MSKASYNIILYSSSTVSSELNIKKKYKPDPRCKGIY